MANACDFSMKIKGSKKDIEMFQKMLECEVNVHIGRGAFVEYTEMQKLEDGKYTCLLEGWVKWSIESALFKNAVSMREHPEEWCFGDIEAGKLKFLTLTEACKQLNLDMEVYSRETIFEEHYKFVDGELIVEECVEYEEFWNAEEECYEAEGGFGEWNFEI